MLRNCVITLSLMATSAPALTFDDSVDPGIASPSLGLEDSPAIADFAFILFAELGDTRALRALGPGPGIMISEGLRIVNDQGDFATIKLNAVRNRPPDLSESTNPEDYDFNGVRAEFFIYDLIATIPVDFDPEVQSLTESISFSFIAGLEYVAELSFDGESFEVPLLKGLFRFGQDDVFVSEAVSASLGPDGDTLTLDIGAVGADGFDFTAFAFGGIIEDPILGRVGVDFFFENGSVNLGAGLFLLDALDLSIFADPVEISQTNTLELRRVTAPTVVPLPPAGFALLGGLGALGLLGRGPRAQRLRRRT